MASGNPRYKFPEIPIEDIYKAVRKHCETNKPGEEFNRIIVGAVNLGIADNRNTLEYKGAINCDSNEDEDESGPSDCYGRNRRGGCRKRS
uniref:Uncharacterized protein n=1 Tax=Glossina morsitans morsitans TaxID=37546 RepID=A0A1B0G5X3_GLOMM